MMEILYLIYIWILKLIGRHRPVTYVFHCPRCDELRMARMDELTHYDERMRPVAGERRFSCMTCKAQYDGDSFAADETGVFHIKMWDCPECKQLNPNTTYMCRECGYKLV